MNRKRSRTLARLALCVMLGTSILQTACATSRAVVIDSRSDVVRLGPGVTGPVYIWQEGKWVLVKKVKLPEGWFAGPMPEPQ